MHHYYITCSQTCTRDTTAANWPLLITYQVIFELQWHKSYVYCISSLLHVSWLLFSVCILHVFLSLVMLLMQLLQCSCRYIHLVSTLVVHQMLVKTWLHVQKKFDTPLYLLVVPLKHGLISASDGQTVTVMKITGQDCTIQLLECWDENLYEDLTKAAGGALNENWGRRIGSNQDSSSQKGECNVCKSYPSWDATGMNQLDILVLGTEAKLGCVNIS